MGSDVYLFYIQCYLGRVLNQNIVLWRVLRGLWSFIQSQACVR